MINTFSLTTFMFQTTKKSLNKKKPTQSSGFFVFLFNIYIIKKNKKI